MERDRLIYGNILDAYGTEAFGSGAAARSDRTGELLTELSGLNIKEIRTGLSDAEKKRQAELRAMLPTGSPLLQLPATTLPDHASRALQLWQSDIDVLPDYASRVAEAKRSWSLRNTKANKTLTAVKETLASMQGMLRRYAYCEDSCADEVGHIRPKDLYPELVFAWANYLYACGCCNVEKRNDFAVFAGATDEWHDVKRGRDAPVLPPRTGEPVLINPRHENPVDFLILDLGTFQFVPLADPGTRDHTRAVYTMSVLSLGREPLRKARENAVHGFRDRLYAYGRAKAEGHAAGELSRSQTSLLHSPHQTVWREMQRQSLISPRLATLYRSRARSPPMVNRESLACAMTRCPLKKSLRFGSPPQYFYRQNIARPLHRERITSANSAHKAGAIPSASG